MNDKGNIATTDPVSDLRVVETKLEGGRLIVTVESDSIAKLVDGAARQLAYNERLKQGMAQAGIEAIGGTYVPEDERAAAEEAGRDVVLWRTDFRITPMI